jgi:surface antigen
MVSRRIRTLVLVLCAAVVPAAAVVSVAQPAYATVTRLCYGYTSCANAGYSNAGYASANKTMYWRMFSGHNCTNYAAYRMVKSGLPNVRPWDGSGNATYWGTSMSSITDGTPRVGAVAWWRAGVYPAGSAGHVAYVERVISNDEIIVSQDSWGGDFSWARVTRESKGWPSGFVHFNDVRLTNSLRPTVSGKPQAGSTLTATPGQWAPGTPTFHYQWRAGGQSIPGATGPTFKLTDDQVGKTVRVRVTARELGYRTTRARSDFTDPVQAGVISNDAVPRVTGDPLVDSTLTADSGSWSPTPDSVTYRWLSDGTPLTGADQPTLTLTPEMAGHALSVRVTAHRDGYSKVRVVSEETPVVRAVPKVHVDLETPAPGRLTVSVTTSGTEDTVLRVRSHGQLLTSVPVQAGAGVAKLKGLASGDRNVKVAVAATSTTTKFVVRKPVTIT